MDCQGSKPLRLSSADFGSLISNHLFVPTASSQHRSNLFLVIHHDHSSISQGDDRKQDRELPEGGTWVSISPPPYWLQDLEKIKFSHLPRPQLPHLENRNYINDSFLQLRETVGSLLKSFLAKNKIKS